MSYCVRRLIHNLYVDFKVVIYLIYLLPKVYWMHCYLIFSVCIKCAVQEACLDACILWRVSDFRSLMGGHTSTSFPWIRMVYWFRHVSCLQLLFSARGFHPWAWSNVMYYVIIINTITTTTITITITTITTTTTTTTTIITTIIRITTTQKLQQQQ